MKIELKNVKFCEWASQETNCFSAIVYADGEPIFTVENDGRGGADIHRACEGHDGQTFRENVKKVEKLIEGKKFRVGEMEFDYDLDVFIDDFFVDWLNAA